jgi:hypothetical protein
LVQRTDIEQSGAAKFSKTISLFKGKHKRTTDEQQGMWERRAGGKPNLSALQKCVSMSSLSKVLKLCQLNLHCHGKKSQVVGLVFGTQNLTIGSMYLNMKWRTIKSSN